MQSGAQHPERTGTGTALRELFVLAAPTVATMTSYTAMQFMDKLMVSQIGSDPVYVGAQGNGGLVSFVPIAVFMGMLTVINTYVSQNLGAGRADRAPAYAWTGLHLSAIAAILLIPYMLLVPWIFGLMGHTVRQVKLASEYGQILLAGAFFTLATRAVAQYFYGMHRPMVVLAAGLIGNAANFIFNSLLIYGHDGLTTGWSALDWWFALTADVAGAVGIPPLGLNGAALATVLGTAVELVIPLAVFLSAKYNRLYATRASWKPSWPHIRDVVRLGWPGGLMFGNEMVCWGFFMVYLVGHFGELHSTAGFIAHQYMSLSFMPAVGLSVAITSMVGKCMGMNRPDLAAQRAWLGMGVGVGYMSLCAVLFVVFREDLVRLFIQRDTPPEDVAVLVRLGSAFLIATAAFQLFDAIAMCLSGALRGAGDTVWPGVATLVLSWSIIVVGGYAMTVLVPSLESIGAWSAAAAYIIVLALVLLARFAGGRWKRLKLLEHSAGAKPPLPGA